ncbi:hypothetical protein C0J52_02628 [Blattella germanica]|nr:hypothetical protein C0J52_02628 [Blattella germanica]
MTKGLLLCVSRNKDDLHSLVLEIKLFCAFEYKNIYIFIIVNATISFRPNINGLLHLNALYYPQFPGI